MFNNLVSGFISGVSAALGTDALTKASKETKNMLLFILLIAVILFFFFGMGRRR